MSRYVKWNVQVIETEPLDIFAHPTWLPAPLDKDFDALWTEARMKPIIAALKRSREPRLIFPFEQVQTHSGTSAKRYLLCNGW